MSSCLAFLVCPNVGDGEANGCNHAGSGDDRTASAMFVKGYVSDGRVVRAVEIWCLRFGGWKVGGLEWRH